MNNIITSIKRDLEIIFSNSFFTTLKTAAINENQWKRFFVQKYGSVAYFLEFLVNGSALCEPYSADLSNVFMKNYYDEIGFINGEHRDEYRHETWRLKSLREFNITPNDLKTALLIPSTQLHSDLIATLPKGKDFLEYCGALLFLEIFVAQEMKHLIRAFERTIPSYFPSGGYDRENVSHNIHEYWYNHMDHDPYHFKQIKEGIENYLEQNKENACGLSPRIIRGIEKCFIAKMHLYDNALMEYMLSE